MKRRNSNNFSMLGIGILVLLIGSLSFYFFYFVRTPSYAVKSIKKAIVTSDVRDFAKYVDLDSVYGLAYKKIVYGAAGNDLGANVLGALAIDVTKDDTVAALKEMTLFAIQHKNMDDIDELDDKRVEVDKLFGRYINNVAKAIKANYELEDVVLVEVNRDRAKVDFLISNKASNKQFKIKTTMSNRQTRHWCIKRIDNIEEVLNNL